MSAAVSAEVEVECAAGLGLAENCEQRYGARAPAEGDRVHADVIAGGAGGAVGGQDDFESEAAEM